MEMRSDFRVYVYSLLQVTFKSFIRARARGVLCWGGRQVREQIQFVLVVLKVVSALFVRLFGQAFSYRDPVSSMLLE
jgi:hypothetical protein